MRYRLRSKDISTHIILIVKTLITFSHPIFLFFFIPTIISASTYYISPSGNNANPGTISHPFRTISFGESRLKAASGDTLFVRGGTYFERLVIHGASGTSSSHTVITAYPSEIAIIDGQNSGTDNEGDVVRIYDNYIDFYGFEIRNSNQDGGAGLYKGVGLELRGRNNLVSHCKIHDTWQNGINGQGDNHIIEYCEIYNASLSNLKGSTSTGYWGAGITLRYDSGTLGTADFCIIRHNIIHDIWGEGLSFAWSKNSTIEDNKIYDCFSVLLYVRNSRYVVIQRNLCYMTKQMDGNLQGSSVGIGLWDESYKQPVLSKISVINNLVYGCEINYYTTKQDTILTAGNTFINSTYSSCVQIGNSNLNHTKGFFTNNIVYQDNPAIKLIYIGGNFTDNLKFDHNLWSRSLSSNIDEIIAKGEGDLVGDPQISKLVLLEPGRLSFEYFVLSSNSPAINSGHNLSGLLNNYYGVPSEGIIDDYLEKHRDMNPDIGALEYSDAAKITDIKVVGKDGATTISNNKGILQLNASITPSSAASIEIIWSITNGTGQATINSTGLVTAVANGTVTAKATAKDGSGVYGTLTITITNQINESRENESPIIILDYNSSSYSGFVNEISASGSYDPNKDNLYFEWIIPGNVPVSSTSGPTIHYLSPDVNKSHIIEFTLKVSDGKTTQSKSFPIEILPYKPELETVEISHIETSAFKAPYYPSNTIDGDVGTMWCAEGDDQWLIMELRQSYNIQHLKLVFRPGQESASFFDILGSKDKFIWEPILTKVASCSFSGELQVFEFPISKAREDFKYIKFVGRCNSTDKWNYITEIKVLGFRDLNSHKYDNNLVKIYPNPAKHDINIQIKEPSLVPDYIQIVDMSGTIVLRKEVESGIGEFKLSINLKEGIYLLHLGSGGTPIFAQKIVISN